MSRYSNVSNDIWYDAEFYELNSNEKLFYFYLLTNPQCNNAGFYRLPPRVIERDLGSSEMVKTKSKLWKYDEDNEVVLIPNYLKYNQSKGITQLKSIANNIRSLPNSPLFVDFANEIIKYCTQDLSFLNEITIKYIRYQIEFREDNVSSFISKIINNI